MHKDRGLLAWLKPGACGREKKNTLSRGQRQDYLSGRDSGHLARFWHLSRTQLLRILWYKHKPHSNH